MDVELERNARIAQFINTILRFKTPCHADLEHVRAEGAKITDDIDCPGLPVLPLGNLLSLDRHLAKAGLDLEYLGVDFRKSLFRLFRLLATVRHLLCGLSGCFFAENAQTLLLRCILRLLLGDSLALFFEAQALLALFAHFLP